ncbi:hypothetical protein HJFPF1_12321 [Paramyrothecium foliicola]|nr:hypothetical protein HJFPF1_12321 [Paramyrothecium foliicola]
MSRSPRPLPLPGQGARRLGKQSEDFQNAIPQVIRPSGHGLLEYDWDKSGDGDPQFSVVPQLDRDEYAHNSLRLRSDHQLCVACKDTFNYFCRFQERQDGPQWMKNNVVHSHSLSALFVSATLVGCFICREIREKVQMMYPDLGLEVHSDYRIECCWDITRGTNKETRMWMVMYDPSVPKMPIHNYQHVLRLGLWPTAHFGMYFAKKTNGGHTIAHRAARDGCANNNTNNHDDTRLLALSWLDRCTQNTDGQHDVCNHKDGNFLPTRLLDVRYALDHGKARLVCSSETPQAFAKSCDYASLSHCWGAWGATRNPVLLSDNIESRKLEGLPWHMLPKTFQDAFKIASWMMLDWLWIDCLCIVQDSKLDWQKEASMMDQVYMEAEVNISADSGEDSRSGCFAQRKNIDISPLEFAAFQGESTWIVTTENTFGWMKSAHSLSRAWIHRERQLSRRILHFTAKEMVWECCGLGKACFASEMMPGGAPFDNVFNGETKFQIQRAEVITATVAMQDTSWQDRHDKLHQLWNSTCQDLSKKSVSYASDLPVILSSLAREFHRLMPDDEYVAGHWRSTLVEALTWWIPGDKPEYNGYIAPSWSWLSAACPVKLYQPSYHQHKRAILEIMNIIAQLGSLNDNQYGQLAEGTVLRVRGFLRRLHFHFTAHEDDGIILSVIEKDAHGQDRLRRIGADWDHDKGQLFRLTTDAALKLPYQEWECYALFTTLGEWGQFQWNCERQLSCLLLEKAVAEEHGGSAKDENYYRRIGTLDHLNDLYSFKLRYQVAKDTAIREAGFSRETFQENPTGYTGQPQSEPWYRKGDSTALKSDQEGEGGSTRESQTGDMPASVGETSSEDEHDSLSTKKKDESAGDAWDLLAQYICRNRWLIIQDFKEEKETEEKTVNSDSKSSGLLYNGKHKEDGHDSQTINDGASQGDVAVNTNSDSSSTEKHEHIETNRVVKETKNDSMVQSETQDTTRAGAQVTSRCSSNDGKGEDSEGSNEDQGHGEDQEGDEKSRNGDEVVAERDERRQEVLRLGAVIYKLHNHPSSGLAPISGAEGRDKIWAQLQETLWLDSETVAYGTDQPHDPVAAMYQFDDVLDMWQEKQGVAPWLRRLEACEITLV